MTTTTIRIEDELKSRLANAAELDDAFHQIADARWAKLMATCKSAPRDETKAYLKARTRGESPKKPAARSFKRCKS
jgi:predicted transcriptional regulator